SDQRQESLRAGDRRFRQQASDISHSRDGRIENYLMEEDPKDYRTKPPSGFFFLGWGLLVLVVLSFTTGLVMARSRLLSRQTAELAIQEEHGPRVLVVPVGRSPETRSIEVPATVHGYVETPVYAKISGYL